MEMRGQIYSIIVIVLAVPLLLFTAFYISSAQTIGSGAVERIVADQEHQIAESMERDFARAIEISAKRGLLVASDSVIISGIGLENSTAGMIELLTNGTLEGNETYLMINNSLNDWRERILGINVGFETGLEFRGLSIENYNGFNLVLGLNMDVNVSDNLNISRIDRNLDLEELIPVSGIEDPLFPINTGGYVKRLIQEYPFPYYSRKIVTGGGEAGCSGNVSFDPSSPDPGKILVVQDAAGVSGFLGVVSETGSIPSVSCYIVGAAGAVNEINASIGESGYLSIYLDNETASAWSLPLVEGADQGYYYPESGPDMLQRLEANLSENMNGFETFVNVDDLINAAIEVKEGKSLVSHLYFSSQSHAGSAVRGFPDWFRIDYEHAVLYGIEELLV